MMMRFAAVVAGEWWVRGGCGGVSWRGVRLAVGGAVVSGCASYVRVGGARGWAVQKGEGMERRDPGVRREDSGVEGATFG